MDLYNLYNATDQGILATWLVDGSSQLLSITIPTAESRSFLARELSPDTARDVAFGRLVSNRGSYVGTPPALEGNGLVWRGPYRASVSYRIGDLMIYAGGVWMAVRAVSGETPVSLPEAWLSFQSGVDLGNHPTDNANPHQVTAAQAGAIPVTEKGAVGGVAPLDGAGRIAESRMPLGVVHARNRDTSLDSNSANAVTSIELRAHLDNLSNPHQVTPNQIGAVPSSIVAQPGGVAPLDQSGRVPPAYLPTASGGSASGLLAVTTVSARDALIPSLASGDLVAVLESNKVWSFNGSGFDDATSSHKWLVWVNGKTGTAVTLTTADVAESGGYYYFTDSRLTSNTTFAAVQAASHARNGDTKLADGTSDEVTAANLKAHLASTSNPHSVTAAQVGAIADVSDDLSPTLGGALDAGGFRIRNLFRPDLDGDAATKAYVDEMATIAAGGGVLTVNGRAGIVTLTATDVGLANVSNAAQVTLAGSQTITGTKHFSSAPTTVVETYGPSWEDSQEVPTKGDLFDYLNALDPGGGATDHAALSTNLAWATSGHTGTDGIAGFDSGGAAVVRARGQGSAEAVPAGNHTHTGLSVEVAGTPSVRALGTGSTEAAAGDHTHTGLSVQSAGTPSVRALGTSSTEAAAGDHTHTGLSVQVAGTPSVRALGTSSTEAAAGDHTHTGLSVQSAGTPSVRAIGTGSTEAAAGDHTHTGLSVQAAGTPSVRALGTLSTEAAAGNHTHTSLSMAEVLDTSGNEAIKFTATASAVNEITLANAATGSGPTFTASGGDTNIDVTVQGKGTGSVILPKVKATLATSAPHADMYVEITSSRDATDADNGKILWSSAAYTLTIPDSLAKPFGCTLVQRGSGAITVAVSGTAVLRNPDSHTKTGGQWSMAAIDYQTGTDVILAGRTAA